MQSEVRWDDVRVFLALARAGNLADAGRKLGVDASTVSRRLAGLEADLGARLFDRTPDGLVATHAAEQLLPSAEEAERCVVRFSNATDGFEAAVEGVVRVSAPPGVAADFLAPGLAGLIDRHPRLRVELDSSIGIVDLTRREADLAIRTIRPTGGDLVMTRLATARYRVLASPALAKELGTVHDWRSLRWIGWGAELAHIPPSRWLERHAADVAPVLRTSSIAAQAAAAESGLGVVLLTEEYTSVRRLTVVRATAALEARTEWPEETVWLVGHRALRDVPRIAAVWDFLVERMEGKRTEKARSVARRSVSR